WAELRVHHWLALPALFAVYLPLAILLLTWPLWVLVAIGNAPHYVDLDTAQWSMFGERFPDAWNPRLGQYWLKILTSGAIASVLWTLIVAVAIPRTRRLFGTLFQPVDPMTVRVVLTYLLTGVGLLLVPA